MTEEVLKCRDVYLHGQMWTEQKDHKTFNCTCNVDNGVASTSCTMANTGKN